MWEPLKIPSLTKEGVTYTVRPSAKGPVCDCPSRRRPCKHERLYLSVQAWLERCQQTHATPPGLLCATCAAAIAAAMARKVGRYYKPKPPRRKAR